MFYDVHEAIIMFYVGIACFNFIAVLLDKDIFSLDPCSERFKSLNRLWGSVKLDRSYDSPL